MTDLTSRQKEIYDFMKSFLVDNHSMPTIQEISDEFNFSSCNGAQSHIDALHKKGALTKHRKGSSKKHGYKLSCVRLTIETLEE